MACIDIVVCGVGAGATYVYNGEASSTFVLRCNGRPLLLLDCGVGAVRSVMSHVGSLPDHVYVSHNHTDHAGDLPVMLAIEAKKGHKMTLLAESNVMSTLATHRLHELQSSGKLSPGVDNTGTSGHDALWMQMHCLRLDFSRAE